MFKEKNIAFNIIQFKLIFAEIYKFLEQLDFQSLSITKSGGEKNEKNEKN